MSEFKGDFLGFTFNGVHSSELGITRVNDSNRHTQITLPTIQDKTVQVPGGDGTYFFNSYFTNRSIPISFAFDDVTELQLRKMRQVFSRKTPCDLIFDEDPYKIYTAKVNAPYTIKEICFLENGRRKYRGEGSLTFICYEPYAHSRWHFLDDLNGFRAKIAHIFQNVITFDNIEGLDLSKPIYIDGYGEAEVDHHFNVHVRATGAGDVVFHNHTLIGENSDIELPTSTTIFPQELVGNYAWQNTDGIIGNHGEWREASGLIFDKDDIYARNAQLSLNNTTIFEFINNIFYMQGGAQDSPEYIFFPVLPSEERTQELLKKLSENNIPVKSLDEKLVIYRDDILGNTEGVFNIYNFLRDDLTSMMFMYDYDLYNPGDIDCPFLLNINYVDRSYIEYTSKVDVTIQLVEKNTNTIVSSLNVMGVTYDNGLNLEFDGKRRLINQINDSGVKTVANGFIESGDFFTIPITTNQDYVLRVILQYYVGNRPSNGYTETERRITRCILSLDYDYLYY